MSDKNQDTVNEVAPVSEAAFVRNFFKDNNALMLEGAASMAIAQAREVDKLRGELKTARFYCSQRNDQLAAERQSISVLIEELATAKRSLKEVTAKFRKFKKLNSVCKV